MKMRRSFISSSDVCKILLFVFFLSLAVFFANFILTNRNSYYKNKDFFDETQNIDVFFMGSSHMELFINPMELWNEYGFTSYNFGAPDEPLQVTYWTLVNALNIKTPKLVVVDAHMFNINKPAAKNRVPYNLEAFPLSNDKLLAMNDISGSFLDKIDMTFKLNRLHSRWKELGKDILVNTEHYVKGSMSYGYFHAMRVTPITWSEYTEDIANIPKNCEDVYYIEKIINVCNENDIDLLFINTPYVSTIEEQKNMHAFEIFADERGLSYLNMADTNNIIDAKVDLWDEGHVNPSGMHKVTDYVGSYLNKNYSLPDYRENDSYECWNREYEEYKLLKYESILYKRDLNTSLMLLHDDDFTSYVYINSDYLGDDKDIFMTLMQNIGRHNITIDDNESICSYEMNALTQLNNMGAGYLLVNDNKSCLSRELTGYDAEKYVKDLLGAYIDELSEQDVLCAVKDNDSQEIKFIQGYNFSDIGYYGEHVYVNMDFKYLF